MRNASAGCRGRASGQIESRKQTTEYTEYTEKRMSFFRVFRVFRGLFSGFNLVRKIISRRRSVDYPASRRNRGGRAMNESVRVNGVSADAAGPLAEIVAEITETACTPASVWPWMYAYRLCCR